MFEPEALAGYLVTVVLTIIDVLVAYVILKRFLFKPAIRFIRKREATVRGQLEAARQREEEAELRFREAAKTVDEAKRDASTIVSDARLSAQNKADAIMSQAKEEASGVISKGNAECDRMRVTLLEGMRGEVADLSVRIASRVIQQYMDESRQREMVEGLIDDELRGKGESEITDAGAAGVH
ncbi:MAG: F0F1 ATP synthase subunit B [Clostridiaceae bacterium]|nr:F0F1 ATP synthase subunit B [Clostridiaceae bacterium]